MNVSWTTVSTFAGSPHPPTRGHRAPGGAARHGRGRRRCRSRTCRGKPRGKTARWRRNRHSTTRPGGQSRLAAEAQARSLRAGEESEGDECRSGAGRDVQRSRRRSVHARDEIGSGVRERDAAARKRKADLTGMQMACENQVERRRREAFDDAREVAQQQAKAGSASTSSCGRARWAR